MYFKIEIFVLLLHFGLGSLEKQCLGLECLKSKNSVNPSHNMLGGDIVYSYDYPFIAAIQDKSMRIICNGVIISNTVVATACHCVAFVKEIRHKLYTKPIIANKAKIWVSAGFGKYDDDVGVAFEQRRPVSDIRIHPKCEKKDIWVNDFALVTVKGYFMFSYLVNQSFIDSNPNRHVWESKVYENLASNRICSVVGFGLKEIRIRENMMLRQKVFLTENGCRGDIKCEITKCKDIIKNGICAFSLDEDQYPGDAAAPLICGDEILGLVTDGRYTAMDFFAIITPINAYPDFYHAKN